MAEVASRSPSRSRSPRRSPPQEPRRRRSRSARRDRDRDLDRDTNRRGSRSPSDAHGKRAEPGARERGPGPPEQHVDRRAKRRRMDTSRSRSRSRSPRRGRDGVEAGLVGSGRKGGSAARSRSRSRSRSARRGEGSTRRGKEDFGRAFRWKSKPGKEGERRGEEGVKRRDGDGDGARGREDAGYRRRHDDGYRPDGFGGRSGAAPEDRQRDRYQDRAPNTAAGRDSGGRNSVADKFGSVSDKFGSANKFGNGTPDAPSAATKKQKKNPAPQRAVAAPQTFIVVTVNDRLGTKASIPCLPSDTVGDFKKLVAAHIGRAPHEIMLKRQSERPFKDFITLGDYGVGNGVQLDLELGTGD